MKVLGCLGGVLAMWGIIWGIFIRSFIWLSVVGMLLMMFYCVFADENE
jgi:hypothetical protein